MARALGTKRKGPSATERIDAGAYLSRFDLNGLKNSTSPVADGHPRERLLLAAVDLFGNRGYEAVSMKDLAAAAALTASGVYNHYSSKLEVLVVAVDFVLSDFTRTVLDGLPSGPAEEDLFEILTRHVLYGMTNVQVRKANDRLLDRDFMARVMPRKDGARLARALAEYVHIVRELVSEVSPGRSELDDGLLTLGILNMLNETGAWYDPKGSMSPQDIAEQSMTLVRRMLLLA